VIFTKSGYTVVCVTTSCFDPGWRCVAVCNQLKRLVVEAIWSRTRRGLGGAKLFSLDADLYVLFMFSIDDGLLICFVVFACGVFALTVRSLFPSLLLSVESATAFGQ
jgi:hypothetical protein